MCKVADQNKRGMLQAIYWINVDLLPQRMTNPIQHGDGREVSTHDLILSEGNKGLRSSKNVNRT